MSDRVEKLHKQMSEMSLGDLLLLAGQAVNLPMDENRIDLILQYVEISLAKRKSRDKRSRDVLEKQKDGLNE